MFKELRREAAFNSLREQTWEVLQQDYIAERLGETGLVLTAALESSFVLHQAGGKVVMPDNQRYTDNIGIYPKLATELYMPGIPNDIVLRAHDRQYLQAAVAEKDLGHLLDEFFREPRGRRQELAGIERNGFVTSLLLTLGLEGEEARKFYARPTVVLQCGSLILSRIINKNSQVKVAVMGHELDHALMQKDVFENELGSVLNSSDDEQRDWRAAVLLERSGYKVSAALLTPKGSAYDDVADILQALEGKDPVEAGAYVWEHIHTLEDRHRCPQALTQMFSGNSPIPSDDEIDAYYAANFVY